MYMSFPRDHVPRYSDFVINGFLDETLREGPERCLFSVSTQNKLPLVRSILKSGIKDIIFGSGPEDPSDIAKVVETLEGEGLLTDQKFSFILLLNCFRPLMPQFASIPAELRKFITISFGMITHDSETLLFERTVAEFRAMGFTSFRVSLLNNFGSTIDEKTFSAITRQIDRSVACGIDVVRINDSLGTIYPEAMAILAANLRHDYPDVNFCLHAHNDRGFGLQNALASLYHGFNLIEGGFASFGNRSGLPSIELLEMIFREKNITISNGALDTESVNQTARLAEQTFMALPDLYRPVSGMLVDFENMGATNIPDYLGASGASNYFLNRIGLHELSMEKIFRELGLTDPKQIKQAVADFGAEIRKDMEQITVRKQFEFQALRRMTESFYDDDVFFTQRVRARAQDYLACQMEAKAA
jgi:2-isopropylmalate synthase